MATRKKARNEPAPAEPESANEFPIVALATSAARIEGLTPFFRGLGEGPGLSVIVICADCDGEHDGALEKRIRELSGVPVTVASDGMAIERDRVYVPPRQHGIGVRNRTLYLSSDTNGSRADTLFCTLAEDQATKAIAVTLSGTSDRTARGTRAIKSEGGISIAEVLDGEADPTARAAMVTGMLDLLLPADGIAEELLRIAQHIPPARALKEQHLVKIFAMLQKRHDVDFTHYKPTTIERRIKRRMALHKVDSTDGYIEIIKQQPEEIDRLYADVLIHVTSFFRDPEVFEELRTVVFPKLMQHDRGVPVRIWVPGCATGEEVYSIAITALEAAHEQKFSNVIQIFGSDISEPVVDYARSGLYPESIAEDVGEERLRRYFVRDGRGYRVAKAVRDTCVFARQNVVKDPPFSRMDLISCRNLLIYLDATLQRRVMGTFYYALSSTGYLLLGSSETIGNFGELFVVADRRHKLYQKRPAATPPRVHFEQPLFTRERFERQPMDDEQQTAPNVFREADRILLSRYAPSGVLINEHMDIVQFRGRTSTFLEPAPGVASFNILKMAREGLLGELRAAILSSRKTNSSVRRDGITLAINGQNTIVALEVIPFATPAKDRYQMVVFEEQGPAPEPAAPVRIRKGAAGEKDLRDALRLKRELEATREYLQSIIEEQDAMNEELRSANEEIQSSNEELQSTNEELETAKEELQSSNEELTTLNEELENRNDELALLNNDLVNLLASVEIPILMLDNALCVRRFNAGAQRTLNLVSADIGRPVGDLKLNLQIEDLDRKVMDVIETLEARELDVSDRGGRQFKLRIRPYRTMENKIEGAVVVLIDVDQFRK